LQDDIELEGRAEVPRELIEQVVAHAEIDFAGQGHEQCNEGVGQNRPGKLDFPNGFSRTEDT
jgi:hypothetical protein